MDATPASTTLRDVARQTLVNSPQLKQVEAKYFASKYQKHRAMGEYLPKVNVFMDNGRERSFINEEQRVLWTKESGIQVEENVFDGLKTMHEVAEAGHAIKSSKFIYRNVAENLLLQSAEVFLNVIRYRRLIALAHQNIAIHQKTLDNVLIRYNSKLSHSGELNLARSRIALARSQLGAFKEQLGVATRQYVAVVGRMPARHLRFPRIPFKYLPKSQESALHQAANRNFQLHAEAEEVEARHELVAAGKSVFFPKIDLAIGYTRKKNLEGVETDERHARAAVNVSYNIFNGASDIAALNITKQEAIRQEEQQAQTYREIIEMASSAWVSLLTKKQQLNELIKYVRYSSNVVRDYKQQYDVGKRALFNVLDAERELFSAEVRKTNVEYDRYIEVYKMLMVISKLSPVMLGQQQG